MEAKLIREKGSPIYSINGNEYSPISFRSFWPNSGSIKNFSDKGFSMFHILPSGVLCSLKVPYSNCGEIWEGHGKYNWDRLREHVDMFIKESPEAKFALLIQLDTRDWYLEDNPEAFDSFENLAIMCRDKKWRESASRFMKDVIDFMEDEYPERVYEIHLFAGHTTEWYANYPDGGLPESKQFTDSFNDWFKDGRTMPTDRELNAAADGILRNPITNKKALEFWEFYNEIIAETIGYFASEVKSYTNGRLLVGVFYGYSMCFFHSYKRGHSGLSTVLANKDIDLIFSPAAYKPFRGMDSVSAFNLPVDSIRLHNKLYLHEIDNITCLTFDNKYANAVQGLHQRTSTMGDTVTYIKRDVARALEHGGGYWLFDMWGGWYDDEFLMEEIKQIKCASEKIYKAGMDSVSEVAVFTDIYSSYHLSDIDEYDSIYAPPEEGKGGIAVQYDTVYSQQEGLNRMGAPVSYYDSKDVIYKDFPHDDYKLYVFLNLLAPSQEIIDMINQLKDMGKSILYLYAPGYITSDGYSIDSMNKLTGFNFSVAEGESCGKIVSCNDSDISWGGNRGVSPFFTVNENECEILARYDQSGLPALAVKKRGNAIDAWCGFGPVPGSILREIAKAAGVFLWHDGDDPVYINESMVGMYSCDGGEKQLKFPKECILESLYENDESHNTNNCELTLNFKPHEFKMFLRNEK